MDSVYFYRLKACIQTVRIVHIALEIVVEGNLLSKLVRVPHEFENSLAGSVII